MYYKRQNKIKDLQYNNKNREEYISGQLRGELGYGQYDIKANQKVIDENNKRIEQLNKEIDKL